MRIGMIVLWICCGGLVQAACQTRVPHAPVTVESAPVAGVAAAQALEADVATAGESDPPEVATPGTHTIAWEESAGGCRLRCARAAALADTDEEDGWAFDADVGLYSKYVWRGILVGDDPVVQGSVTASYGGFFLNVWANVDLTDIHRTEFELNEINLTPNYTHRIKSCGVPLDLSVGAIAYIFPATATNTQTELYAALSADVLLQPAVTVWHEVLDIDSTYVSIDVGHTFDMGCWELELDAGVGWGDRRWHRALSDADLRGMNDLTLSANAIIGRGRWQLLPKIGYSSLLGGDLRSAVAKPDLWVAALILTTSF